MSSVVVAILIVGLALVVCAIFCVLMLQDLVKELRIIRTKL